LTLAVFFLAGCGDKTPESQTAVEVGKKPKQIVDKAAADVNKALQTGTAARQEAEKKE
jgi:hypothetical protein